MGKFIAHGADRMQLAPPFRADDPRRIGHIDLSAEASQWLQAFEQLVLHLFRIGIRPTINDRHAQGMIEQDSKLHGPGRMHIAT